MTRRLTTVVESFPLKKPFQITGHLFATTDVLVVSIEQDGAVGRGEGTGMYYRPGDDITGMQKQVEQVREQVEAGLNRERLITVLPAGGARTALDCALWDLEAKLAGRPVWELAGLSQPKPLVTTFTLSANTPEIMAQDALAYGQARALKLKLLGDALDRERVLQVRRVRPDAWIMVDANQGFTLDSLKSLAPVLRTAEVALVEQPFRVGQEILLKGLDIGIPLAADESAVEIGDLVALADKVQLINIKLDKCGGLTAGLAMAREALDRGFKVMIGNTGATSLSMAPASMVGQLCEVVDLDGPLFLAQDRTPGATYIDGRIEVPEVVWGAGA